MRIEVLSEHPDAMLATAVRWRRGRVLERAARVESARQDRDRARSERRWLTWARLALAVSRAKREAARQPVAPHVPSGREEALRAGRNAERRVARQLARSLDHSWVLFRGYRNARGEIDGLLLGPRGLFAIEVKHRNATVYIRGDDWQAQRFDREGHSRGARIPMRDARGRSPSEQLTEPVAALGRWLRENGRETPITPVVLLTHDNGRVGSLERPTVQVVRSVRSLVALVSRSPARLDGKRCEEIGRLIRRDHKFHQGTRPVS